MDSPVHRAILDLKSKSNIDNEILNKFLKLHNNRHLTRDEGVTDHFCVGCIIISEKHKKIFLGHHKKSNSWMGIGGHIDKNESPDQAIRREFKEELQTTSPDNITFFNIAHFTIRGRKECTNHYDFFYIVNFDELVDFNYDTSEFKKAYWMTFEEALKKHLLAPYRRTLQNVMKHTFS